MTVPGSGHPEGSSQTPDIPSKVEQDSSTEPAVPAPGNVLGPVAAKGPKRWGVEPDWSKIPSEALGRLNRKDPDGPQWGTSATDARRLATQDQEPQPAWNLPGFSTPDAPAETDQAEPAKTLPATTKGEPAPTHVGPNALLAAERPGPSGVDHVAPGLSPAAPREQASAAPVPEVDTSGDHYVPIFDEPDFDEPPYPDDLSYPDPFEPHTVPPASGPGPDAPAPTPASASTPAPLRSGAELEAQAQAALTKLVGSDAARLRPDQWTAIEALVAYQRRALVVQRTGWGKSAVYFVATSLLRAQGHGPTIIISPLLALMRDQIAAAQRAGIKAVTINSANVTEWDEIHAAISAGEIDVLLCSPERLNNPAFRDTVLPRLAHSAGLVVVDEAHCISDWGHDFRPDYRRIRTLLTELPTGIPVLATTATANERVTTDIAEQLAATDAAHSEVLVLRGTLDRDSLHLGVVSLGDQPQRVAWLNAALNQVPGSGIIYCLTISQAQEVTEQLRAGGHNVATYTGQTDPTERELLESQLKNNEVKALVATSALGMGFDKPDLGFVFHLGAPSSPIAYYQQVGRAGRGVAQALVVLLPGSEDKRIWDYFGSQSFPDQDQVTRTLSVLEAARAQGNPTVSLPVLETQVDLKRTRLELMLKVLDVDGAVTRVQGGWQATGTQWHYDQDRYTRVAQARDAEQQAMITYIGLQTCRMVFLRGVLDDPTLDQGNCGRCDNCGGLNFVVNLDPETVKTARAAMDRPGLEFAPRKMWPTALKNLNIDLSGRIATEDQAQPGRVIARLDGLGWSAPLRELFTPGAPDQEVPVALRTAAAQVLSAWPQIQQVEGIVAVRSTTRPVLTHHLAQGLSTLLGKPLIGAIGPVAGHQAPDRHDTNSALRLASVVRRLESQLSGPAAAGIPGRTILLVDDYVDSGWTMTVATKILKDLGAGTVLPFALAQF